MQAAAACLLPRICAADADPSDFAHRIFSLINEIRDVNRVGPLEWSEAAAKCASQQSLRKVELRFPGHNDPERGDVAQRLRAAGISWERCGENAFMEKGWDDPVRFAAVFLPRLFTS